MLKNNRQLMYMTHIFIVIDYQFARSIQELNQMAQIYIFNNDQAIKLLQQRLHIIII